MIITMIAIGAKMGAHKVHVILWCKKFMYNSHMYHFPRIRFRTKRRNKEGFQCAQGGP
jgi:hypothetical protein